MKYVAFAVTVLGISACSAAPGGAPGAGPYPERPAGATGGPGGVPLADAFRAYQRAGLITETGAFPFVGSVVHFAGPTRDSTITLVTLSFANRLLTFTRESGQYRATYEARVELRQGGPGGPVAAHAESTHMVRVATYPETLRSTESVIFQQSLTASPGPYQLTLYLHDAGSPRSASKDVAITVPRLDSSSLSSPATVYEATPRAVVDSPPHLVVSPRSTATFGRDTAIDVYVEGYGNGSQLPLDVAVHADTLPATMWTETVTLPRHGAVFSGVAVVPVARIGIGMVSLVFRRSGPGGSTSDSVRTPVFVGFGEDLPVGTWDEMLNYLKYFAARDKVDALRHVPPDQRATAWATFVRETNPAPSSPRNEALESYFGRLRQANERFRDEGIPGWETDRGMVFMTVGEPDQIYMQGSLNVSARGREQVWVYRQYNVQLVFVDQTGTGRYRLTPRSMAEYQSILRRVQQQQQRGQGQSQGL